MFMIREDSPTVLTVTDLTAEVEGKPILKGLNLEIRAGEIHAIMGPNGSGKSTFSKILAGHPGYTVTGGQITFQEQDGFSGGEKKRNEILQMATLEPTLAILDETDSGLDIDALKIVANGINQLATPDNATLLITHYQRLLNYVTPDYVHVMEGGRIVTTGGKELALELEERGYDWIKDAESAVVME
jgi:Fe-S cluster assembly ATPase SufC